MSTEQLDIVDNNILAMDVFILISRDANTQLQELQRNAYVSFTNLLS